MGDRKCTACSKFAASLETERILEPPLPSFGLTDCQHIYINPKLTNNTDFDLEDGISMFRRHLGKKTRFQTTPKLKKQDQRKREINTDGKSN
jgi:hypothetical protein